MSSPYEIRYPANFVPALAEYPYVTEGKYVKGTYIVAETFEDINNLPTESLADGVPAYVSTTQKAYRYNYGDHEWVPEELPSKVKAELEQQLAQERLARQQAISAEANARQSADDSLRADLNQEITNRTSADAALGVRIDTNVSNISAEIARATGAESALDTKITNETTARENADTAINNRINESCVWVSF